MKASKIFVWGILLVCLGIFAGCSATSQTKPNLVLDTGHNKYPVCAFSVESNRKKIRCLHRLPGRENNLFISQRIDWIGGGGFDGLKADS
jgi:hypothetical protein